MTDTLTDQADDRSWAPDDVAELDADPSVSPDRDQGDESSEQAPSSLVLFDGDDGWLDLGQRRALVVLLKKRFISAQTDPREWKALIANPKPIRSRLHDMFLDLHLDTEREVAFKRAVQSEAGGLPFPTLLYDAAWGREDTLVLVYLRSRFRNETAAGSERVFVDVADIVEYVSAFRPGSATDRAGDTRRTLKAVETVYKAGLLIGPATGDRFQVSNAIEPLLTLETLQTLHAWLREGNGDGSAADPDAPPQTDTGADAAPAAADGDTDLTPTDEQEEQLR